MDTQNSRIQQLFRSDHSNHSDTTWSIQKEYEEDSIFVEQRLFSAKIKLDSLNELHTESIDKIKMLK